MSSELRRFTGAVVCILALLLGDEAGAVEMEWVLVEAPGNADGVYGFGAVDYYYQIGAYEVTNAQYAEFLNAVAATDPYDLYDSRMAGSHGGIARSGASGSYTYATIAGREQRPVTYVSFYDCLRFVNWLENGQPTSSEDPWATEDGAYAFGDATNVGPRHADATIFLPNEDEWFKAAYFDPWLDDYHRYPTGTSTLPTCAAPGATPNTAKCFIGDPNEGHPPVFATDVGGYTGSPSPNGTFDQGGNVWEWNETMFSYGRVQRGGSFKYTADALRASGQAHDIPTNARDDVGFRVASVPEPGKALALAASILTLWGVRRSRFAV